MKLYFRENIEIYEHPQEGIYLGTDLFSFKIKNPSNGIRSVIEILKKEGATEDELANIIIGIDGAAGLAIFYYYLERFNKLLMFTKSYVHKEKKVFTIEPISPYYEWKKENSLPSSNFMLSRFSFIRKFKDKIILESPLSYVRIILFDPILFQIIFYLSNPINPKNIQLNIDKELIDKFLLVLLENNFIISIDDKYNPEEENSILLQWDFHDLLFHSRSRIGRHDQVVGATYPYVNKLEPQPAYKLPMSSIRIPLMKPDMDKLILEDYPFSLILEQRDSIRDYGAKPITLQQIGEFLYRSSRIKAVRENDPENLEKYVITERPYPGGGAAYELELYLTINKCDGLESGIYYYDSLNHELQKLCERNWFVDQLIFRATNSAAKLCTPQVLITYTARFQRLQWKYEAMAYATVLKDVGALYQTMYLVATAMELAPCALGNGDSDLLCKALGLDYLVESPVGEFLIGSKRI